MPVHPPARAAARGTPVSAIACSSMAAFETFESLYLPHLIVAGPAGQVQARGIVVILEQLPLRLRAANTLYWVRDHPQNRM